MSKALTMSINSYLERIHSFVERVKRETDISHMRGPYKVGEDPHAATWQDKVWQHEDNNGKKTNFIFALNTSGQTRISTIDKHDLLASPWHELLKAYALHLTTQHLGAINKRKKVSTARQFIVDSEFFLTFACNEVVRYWKKEGCGRNMGLLNHFIKWLKSNALIPPNTQMLKDGREAKDGTEELQSMRAQLPDEKAIMVMGAIQHDVIPWDISTWKQKHPLDNQRDAFVCSMFALSLSSPNRVEAEQTVLNLQSLKIMCEVIDGKEEKVHYLEWSGSKGFDDNKKHIVKDMAPVVSHVLNYIAEITQANRVLARFYKKPLSPLEDILQGFRVNEENWQAVKPDPSQPTNLFVLGYLLGFYDRAAIKKVRVSIETKNSIKEIVRNNQEIYFKPIAKLMLEDIVILHKSSVNLSVLLGVATKGGKSIVFPQMKYGAVSINDIQTWWLAHLKKQYPLFPSIRNQTKEGSCDIEHRLFALNSAQLNLQGMSGGNDYKGSISPFAIISPITIGKVYANDLAGGGQSKTIFERYGFSKTFRITPHQMRHFMTDAADKGGLPIIVNNMWGGRKDPSQLIHYVHSTSDERASIISDILYDEDGRDQEEIKNSIRLMSREEYENATSEQGVASVTSSGICTQNLMVTPCQYLNDLNTQCVGCVKSCHVAHDKDSISLLKKDLAVQEQRLLHVQARPQFKNSDAMQSWFKIHLTNTERLKQLIELMTDPDIKPGNLIRILVDAAEFRISNLKTKQIEIRKLSLPDAKTALLRLLESKQEKGNDVVNQLLELF